MSSFLPHVLACVVFLLGTAGAVRSQPAVQGKERTQNPPTDKDGDALPSTTITRLGSLRLQHGGAISHLLFTHDGKGLLSAGGEAILRMWDPATGKEIRQFAGHDALVESMALSPDGKMLASSGRDQTIRLWDVATGLQLRYWSVTEGASLPVAFSANGKLLASGGKDNSIVLWDVQTGKEVRQFKSAEHGREGPFVRPQASLLSLAFTPDGRYLLSAQEDSVLLRDLTTGKCIRRYGSPFGGGWSMGIRGVGRRMVSASDIHKSLSSSADSQTFLMPSAAAQGAMSVWEVNSAEERGRLEGHQNVVLVARFSPDGKTLASAGVDETVRIWDAASLKEVLKLSIGSDMVTDLAIAPDGQTVALGSAHGRIRLWNFKTGKEQATGERLEPAQAIGFTSDGRRVVALDAQSIHHWDVKTGKEMSKVQFGEEKGAGAWQLSADRRLLAQARPGQPIRLLDAMTGKEVRVLEGKPEQVLQLALAPDGRLVGAVTMTGDPNEMPTCTIHLWDATTGKEFQQLPTRLSPQMTLAISPDSRTVVAGEPSSGFRVWEVATGKERRRLGKPSRSPRPGEEWMEMRMAMMMRRRAFMVEGVTEPTSALVFTPDGREVAIEDGDTIRVWDLASGKVVRRFGCEGRGQGEFTFSPDGRLLAAGGPDHEVWIWDNARAALLARLQGHRGPIHSLTFSSDSAALVSSSEDGTALVWDVRQAIAASGPPPRVAPSEETLAALWTDLADSDAARAYGAIQRLTEAPQPALRLLRERLRPALAADSQRIAELIADLDAPEFRVREKASEELGQFQERVAPALEKALAAGPSPELRRRLQELLHKVQRHDLLADTLRAVRAVEVLEGIGTREARQQLEVLARGVAEARLTKEAKAALERLSKQTRPEKDKAPGAAPGG
jgi:WD40 repeat protein